jgi:hypothetical protein
MSYSDVIFAFLVFDFEKIHVIKKRVLEMKYAFEVTFPAEAYKEVSYHDHWGRQGIKTEYGVLHTKQKAALGSLSEFCERLDKLYSATSDLNVQRYLMDIKDYLLLTTSSVILDMKP